MAERVGHRKFRVDRCSGIPPIGLRPCAIRVRLRLAGYTPGYNLPRWVVGRQNPRREKGREIHLYRRRVTRCPGGRRYHHVDNDIELVHILGQWIQGGIPPGSL